MLAGVASQRIQNRRWFDNDQNVTPQCEAMYMEELRLFSAYLKQHTELEEDLRGLNLLGRGQHTRTPAKWPLAPPGRRAFFLPRCSVCPLRGEQIPFLLAASGQIHRCSVRTGSGLPICRPELRWSRELERPGRERTLHRCTLLRYESGPLYKPSRRDVPLVLKDVDAAEAVRMRSIWTYWEQGAVTFEMAAGGGEGAEASEGEGESEAPAPM